MTQRHGESVVDGGLLDMMAEARAFTREHYPIGHPGKYVGHMKADDFDRGVDLLIEECRLLRAEVERHRKANLVRAVLDGLSDEWITEYINRQDFDAIPWRIAEQTLARARAAEDAG